MKNMRMKILLSVLIFSVILPILSCTSHTKKSSTAIRENTDIREKMYTIQTGSYAKKTDARKEYESVKERINGEDLDYLRIEKIGKYYAVRIGRFNDFEQSEKFLKSVKPQILSSVTLKAYIKVDRIVRLYE